MALSPAERRGDTLIVGAQRLLGASRVAAVAGRGTIWGGALYELPLGPAPQADVDGNGIVGDTLPVVVVKGSDGWELFADTGEDGTLANDQPVHDYAVAREYFGWHHGGAAAPIDLAVNFADSAGSPLLDLFFDTEGHGSHVTGIAAGHDIYGVPGFDGVAPGAQVIGIKIANDAAGGVTVTGSMIEALEYAVTYARNRGMPLVVNLSFGVGNELEGTARIDRMIDSVLARHPDVVMSVAASNDGPGLSTIGFPGERDAGAGRRRRDAAGICRRAARRYRPAAAGLVLQPRRRTGRSRCRRTRRGVFHRSRVCDRQRTGRGDEHGRAGSDRAGGPARVGAQGQRTECARRHGGPGAPGQCPSAALGRRGRSGGRSSRPRRGVGLAGPREDRCRSLRSMWVPFTAAERCT